MLTDVLLDAPPALTRTPAKVKVNGDECQTIYNRNMALCSTPHNLTTSRIHFSHSLVFCTLVLCVRFCAISNVFFEIILIANHFMISTILRSHNRRTASHFKTIATIRSDDTGGLGAGGVGGRVSAREASISVKISISINYMNMR